MQKIVLASGNAGKLREFSALLAGMGFDVIKQSDLAVVEAEETGLSFVENALLKARNAALQTGLPALADDSGLVVDALQGRPGIYSARYAGEPGNDQANNRLLLQELSGVAPEQRTARFRCCIVFMQHAHDPVPLIAEAAWEGYILPEPQGEQGFGYDPLFAVAGRGCSAAQLSAEEKNRISHRGQAMQRLRTMLLAKGEPGEQEG